MINIFFVDDSDADIPPPPPASAKIPLLRPTLQRDNTLSTRTDKVIVYWVSYLEGQQRVLLLTQDERVAKRARKVGGFYDYYVNTISLGINDLYVREYAKAKTLTKIICR